ncbi:hypothetical protein HYX11_02990 [Candidatus Woesearchaeota archaeon]|nr:hypothetical protein [Candidatus Woesearchaeota archaeon]
MISIQESGLQTILETSEPVFYNGPRVELQPDYTIEVALYGQQSIAMYDVNDISNIFKQVFFSVLPDYVTSEDFVQGTGRPGVYNATISIRRKLSTSHPKYNILFEMELVALNKKEEIASTHSYFFDSLAKTNKLLIKKAVLTEVFSDKEKQYYNSMFKLPYTSRDCLNIIVTSILNGNSVADTLARYDSDPANKYINHYPIGIPNTHSDAPQYYVSFNILNPTIARVRDASIEYSKFMDHLRNNLEKCIDASNILYLQQYLSSFSKKINNNDDQEEIKHTASEFCERADELIRQINFDPSRFSILRSVTSQPRIDCVTQPE